MSINNLNALNNFIEGYKELKDKSENKESISTLINLPRFLEGYYHVKETIINQNRHTAPEYNIFKIARFETLESKLHSPFIANLLDPEGSHSQGTLFLRSFFKNIPGLNESIVNTWDLRYLSVINELGTGSFGNIDIVIRYNHPLTPYILIIENKIYADDQELQIERYYNYAKNNLRLHDDQIKILYLTLSGSEPSKYSLPKDKSDQLLANSVLECISYLKHIMPWLQNTISEIKAPIVNYTILQYLLTLKSF